MEKEPTNDVLLDAFHAHLISLNRSRLTIKVYVANTQKFFKFIAGHGASIASDVSCQDIEKYQAHLLALPDNCTRTVEAYMRSVRAFYKFLVRQEIIIANPAELVPLPKLPRQLPRNVLTECEARLLLNQPNTKDDVGILHRAIMDLFYSAGLRLSELCSLKVGDVDTANGFVNVVDGKGGRDRRTPIGNSACLWVRAYREMVRPSLTGKKSGDYLFLGSRVGNPISQIIVQQFVRKYAKEAGITKKVSPHVLRSTCATHLLKNGMSLLQVREILGHQLISTTQVYTKLVPKDLIEAHERFHPMARKAEEKQ